MPLIPNVCLLDRDDCCTISRLDDDDACILVYMAGYRAFAFYGYHAFAFSRLIGPLDSQTVSIWSSASSGLADYSIHHRTSVPVGGEEQVFTLSIIAEAKAPWPAQDL